MSDWTPEAQQQTTRALLGSWPGTITAWGKDAFAAYLGELRARGLTPEDVLTAIRTWPAGSDFPPSAPNLAAAARKDPSAPSFEEAWELIRVCLRVSVPTSVLYPDRLDERPELDEQARLERAQQPDMHLRIAPFIVRQGGPARLLSLGLDDPENEFREARRHELRRAWERFMEDADGREVAALASRSGRDGLGRFDPLAALGRGQAQIETTTEGSEGAV